MNGGVSEGRHLIWSFVKVAESDCAVARWLHIRHKMAVLRLAPAGLALTHANEPETIMRSLGAR